MLPFHDINPVRRTPWVTYLLIAANIVVFVLSPVAATAGVGAVGLADLCQVQAFYDRFAAIPAELLNNQPQPEVATGQVGVGPQGPGCVLVYSAGYAVSEAGSVAYLAHVLGFLVGMLVALPVGARRRRALRRHRRGPGRPGLT